ncbi:hypothetical protein N7541_001937 [Penicillium brevicompactum]|uniref:Uncharacterized protein n=1 Tax=Penicillium brevicompactum TaxID=5074 RepID=A0A9W9RNX1_PENBR|nr:hypothetical protein N7541_001937 [Penicillium brevicompactum]
MYPISTLRAVETNPSPSFSAHSHDETVTWYRTDDNKDTLNLWGKKPPNNTTFDLPFKSTTKKVYHNVHPATRLHPASPWGRDVSTLTYHGYREQNLYKAVSRQLFKMIQ